MRIRAKLFAPYRELIGEPEVWLDIDPGRTVADAVEALQKAHPVLARQPYRPLTACNLRHVPGSHVLAEGDELALLPPVSGG